ncbi:MAG: DUF58 domain-containing protein [Burkholderiaceae bacterium]|nr:DUF58 domain-containing protein [Microbacteriaceae bacterium]
MPSLLRKVKSKLSIHAHRRVSALLEGEYSSLLHGRSVEFDDLRHYVPGDELTDIDWKATARMGTPMTRRYVATRKHTIMFVADTGRDMAAISAAGETKADIAVLAAGVLGYLATRHGDLVGLIAGDSGHTGFRRAASTDGHLEGVLQFIHAATTLDSRPSDLTTQLSYLARRFRRRMIVVVVSDDRRLGDTETALLQRLAVQHEILWITICDADPTSGELASATVFEVADGARLPAFLRSSHGLAHEYAERVAADARAIGDLFDRLGITTTRIEREADVVPAVLRLLVEHRRARR